MKSLFEELLPMVDEMILGINRCFSEKLSEEKNWFFFGVPGFSSI
jgi:hypothetical protein